MSLTQEQVDTLEQGAGLVKAARMTVEDAIVLLTMARVFGLSTTRALVDVCNDMIEFENQAQTEIEAFGPPEEELIEPPPET